MTSTAPRRRRDTARTAGPPGREEARRRGQGHRAALRKENAALDGRALSGGSPAGRRRSSPGRGTRSSREGELARVREEGPVGRPQLAVLLEEAVAREVGAKDAEDRPGVARHRGADVDREVDGRCPELAG